MILSAHQPAYLPWLGYFDKVVKCDAFVFLDSVQFEKNSFINRNRIKTPQGLVWLTVPIKIKGHLTKTIKEVEIDYSKNWQQKHLDTIYFNYKKALRFDECFYKLECMYQVKHEFIADLCWVHFTFWLQELGINKKVIRTSELPISSKKSEFIFDLCNFFGATSYLSGVMGKDYLDENAFNLGNIKIVYQKFENPVYRQLWGDFVEGLSIIDFWMNSFDMRLLNRSSENEFLKRME